MSRLLNKNKANTAMHDAHIRVSAKDETPAKSHSDQVMKEISHFNHQLCLKQQKLIWKRRGLKARQFRQLTALDQQVVQQQINELDQAIANYQQRIDRSEAMLKDLITQTSSLKS